MNARSKKIVAQAIVRAIPAFRHVRAGWLAMLPVDRIVRGLCINGSIDPGAFYLEWFVQPLYVPADDFHLTYGERLALDRSWTTDEVEGAVSAVKQEALPKLRQLASVKALMASELLRDTDSAKAAEALAYSMVLCGDPEGGRAKLLALVRALTGDLFLWEVRIRERAELIAGLLAANPAHAIEQLNQWQGEMIRKLRLQ
jgi:hypothetical protein